MYYTCKKCKQKFGTTKPLKHGTLTIAIYPDVPDETICDGKVIGLTYEEYYERK